MSNAAKGLPRELCARVGEERDFDAANVAAVSFFAYRSDGVLHAEDVPLERIAREFGTPCYVYSRAALESAYREFDSAFRGHDVLVCYAVKANSNLAILNLLARLGCGFDIVSGGELARVRAAGGDPAKVVFSGVGKSEEEIRVALAAGILCFNVESEAELERIARLARQTATAAPVALRVNPDVDPRTHPYIATGLRENKFGIEYEQALALYRRAARERSLRVTGIACHIGSQLLEIEPFVAALERLLALLEQLAREGIAITHLDLGGGLGIRYRDEQPPTPQQYAARLLARLGERRLKLLFEPGRWLAGNCGVLLTRVEYLKKSAARNFAITDAAMNDLLRPALYDAWHEILPVQQNRALPEDLYDVVGPVCESADFLGRARRLALAAGDLLAVMTTGAYGMSMSSNYNSRPRCAEVIVDRDTAYLVRQRETLEALFAGERVLP